MTPERRAEIKQTHACLIAKPGSNAIGNCHEKTSCDCTVVELLSELERVEAERDEFQYKLECLLCHASGNMASKANYTIETMYSVVNDHIEREVEEHADALRAQLMEKDEVIINMTQANSEDVNKLMNYSLKLGLEIKDLQLKLANSEGMVRRMEMRLNKVLGGNDDELG